MKNKFKFLVNAGLERKIKTKWFLIANIVLLLSIVAISNVYSIIPFFVV